MANPTLKNGYFCIANELAEQFAKINLHGEEWRILWVLLRKTWGYKKGNRRKDWDWISITQFEEATGMKRANVWRTIQSLLAHKLILKQEKQLKFNQNHNEWVLAHKLMLAHRLTEVLAPELQSISSQTNESVSSQTKDKRKKEIYTKERNQEAINKELDKMRKDLADALAVKLNQ
jgi:phage replication O-like protein O